MSELAPIEIAASGMRAQRIRMGVVASNLANSHSTRHADGTGGYQRQMVVAQAGRLPGFEDLMRVARAEHDLLGLRPEQSRTLLKEHLRGVQVVQIATDPSVRTVYDPDHPDADPTTGLVTYPDISVMQEMTDMISASRNYEANLAVVKNTRDMIMQLLELMQA